jgi:bacillopeptidase F
MAWLAVTLALLLVGAGVSWAEVMAPDLQAMLDGAAPREAVPVIVVCEDGVALDALPKRRGRRARRAHLVRALRDNAEQSQRDLKLLLRRRGAGESVNLWAINAVSLRARPRLIRELARHPGISAIRYDATVDAPPLVFDAAAPAEWHLDAIRAPELWSLGFRGAGVVVAGMDSGADLDHPDLAGRWRGGTNSWFDPNGEHATPFDSSGHGTQTLGLMVGGDAGGTAIGVAPDATWIAAKIFNDAGEATLSRIHLAFQWLLDPDGDPMTDDAPDVVNNSWNLSGTLNECVPEFTPDIELLKAAGIAVTFSASNLGPGAFTSVSPANGSGFATGAVDSSLSIASFSSRGPSACGGGLYPQIAAPGVAVRSADLTFGGVFPNSYASVTGTSFAAPQTAGGMALLRGAFPDATVQELEHAVEDSALDLGLPGPDDTFGYGLLDVMAAYQTLSSAAPCVCEPTIAITADSKCEKKHASTNYSDDVELSADADSEKYTLLKVDVAGTGDAVTGAMLHLTVRDAKSANSESGGMIQRISDCSWNPGTIDYAQAESLALLDGTPQQEQGPVDRGDPVSFDLSPWITGDGTYCFALTSPTSDGVDFYATESAESPPQVTLTADCSCTTTTTTVPPSTTTLPTTTTTVPTTTTTLPTTTTTVPTTTTTVPTTTTTVPTTTTTTTVPPTTTTLPTTTTTTPSTTTTTTTTRMSCSPTGAVLQDVRCRESDPNDNFNDATLQADHKSGRLFYKFSILQVDLSDTQGTIAALRLRLTVSGPSDHAGQIRLLSAASCQDFIDNGGESGATYANSVDLFADAGSPMSSSVAGDVGPGDTVEFDLQALGIDGDGTYCVAVTSPSSDSVKYHSRDAATSASNTPQLLLSTTCDS